MKNKNGQAAITAVILMLIIMLSAVFGASSVALKESRVANEGANGRFSFFAAEAGTDDAVYRLRRGKIVTNSFTIILNGASATTTVTTVGSIKNVKSTGDYSSATRATSAQLSNTTGVSFYFGVQVGDTGLTLGNGSMVKGNVFSNGDIKGNDEDKSRITGNAQVAGAHSIKDIRVNNGASAHSFDECIVDGILKYVSSYGSCTASSTQTLGGDIAPQDFPITDAQITQWTNDAAAGGTLNGLDIGSNTAATTGPQRIIGDVTMGNSSTLTITGTVWVTGTVTFGNSAKIRLDPINYGSLSGVLIVGKSVTVGNGALLVGTGRSGSYLMLLATSTGTAIDIGNTASSTIFYAPNGTIDTGNNLNLREATGKGLSVGNGATITYESGLANVNFTSGPSGGWNITGWGEIVP